MNCIVTLPFIDFKTGNSYRRINLREDRRGFSDLYGALLDAGTSENNNHIMIKKPEQDAIKRVENLFSRNGMSVPNDIIYFVMYGDNIAEYGGPNQKNEFASDLLRTKDDHPTFLGFHGAVALFSESLWNKWKEEDLSVSEDDLNNLDLEYE